jgi:hypothetical protein
MRLGAISIRGSARTATNVAIGNAKGDHEIVGPRHSNQNTDRRFLQQGSPSESQGACDAKAFLVTAS